jgi:Family of unknown function (DUF6526)
MPEQNFANHTKFFPLFHFFVMPVMLLNFGWSIWRWRVAGWSVNGFESVLFAFALIAGFLGARMMALTVQNRVIRLEERLRCERVLPPDLKPRIGEFTVEQVVALRFASDAELPALARKVLDEKINERKTIKQMVKAWRPDYLRA